MVAALVLIGPDVPSKNAIFIMKKHRSLIIGFVLACALLAGLASMAAAATSWPVVQHYNGYTITWYEPQATDWADYKTLSARMAVAVLAPAKTTPFYGVVNLQADTVADAQANT